MSPQSHISADCDLYDSGSNNPGPPGRPDTPTGSDFADARIYAALDRYFGYPGFRPGQEALVRAPLEGRDSLGILPTGGGKTVCFQLPAVLLPGLTVVVSPLISLMQDQLRRAEEGGIAAALLNSTLTASLREAVEIRIRAGRLKLLFLAPERFESDAMIALLRSADVSMFAIDEAHCISAWGHDFRPAYRRLSRLKPLFNRPVMAVTATATPRVRADIEATLSLDNPVRVVGGFDRPNLGWGVVRATSHSEKIRAIRRELREQQGTAIVYAGTQRAVEAIRDRIASWGIPASSYHGGLPAEERSEVQRLFIERGRLVVATNAFGMGIDKPDVRLVLHYQLPGTLEGYYQEAGRAGRDGNPARCIACWGPGDQRLGRSLLDLSRPPSRWLLSVRNALLKYRARGGRVPLTLSGIGKLARPTLSSDQALAALRALNRQNVLWTAAPLPESPAPPDTTVRLIARSGTPDLSGVEEIRRAGLTQLDSIEGYATTRGCRRRYILNYFGEVEPAEHRSQCDRCDRCNRA